MAHCCPVCEACDGVWSGEVCNVDQLIVLCDPRDQSVEERSSLNPAS